MMPVAKPFRAAQKVELAEPDLQPVAGLATCPGDLGCTAASIFETALAV